MTLLREPNMADQSEMVTLTLTFTGAEGRALGSPLVVRLPKEMKLKIAKMHVLDMIARTSEATVDAALKGLGLK